MAGIVSDLEEKKAREEEEEKSMHVVVGVEQEPPVAIQRDDGLADLHRKISDIRAAIIFDFDGLDSRNTEERTGALIEFIRGTQEREFTVGGIFQGANLDFFCSKRPADELETADKIKNFTAYNIIPDIITRAVFGKIDQQRSVTVYGIEDQGNLEPLSKQQLERVYEALGKDRAGPLYGAEDALALLEQGKIRRSFCENVSDFFDGVERRNQESFRSVDQGLSILYGFTLIAGVVASVGYANGNVTEENTYNKVCLYTGAVFMGVMEGAVAAGMALFAKNTTMQARDQFCTRTSHDELPVGSFGEDTPLPEIVRIEDNRLQNNVEQQAPSGVLNDSRIGNSPVKARIAGVVG